MLRSLSPLPLFACALKPDAMPTPITRPCTTNTRITRTRRSIVTSIAGTTRDVIDEPAAYGETPFRLVDTGGMFGASKDPLHELVIVQGRRALETADVIVFVVDGREGLVSGDQEIASYLRTSKAPVLMAVNKTDDKKARGRVLEFHELGFEPVVEIAAEGLGVQAVVAVGHCVPSRNRPTH